MATGIGMFSLTADAEGQKPKKADTPIVVTPDGLEALAAFAYLNDVRKNPAAFSAEVGADLSKVGPRPALVWNDTLAKVALAKATDMAQRDYTGHVTPEGLGINSMIHAAGYKLPDAWITPKSLNYFESFWNNATDGKNAIRTFIADPGHPDGEHRVHLLGLDAFHADSVDTGIAFVRSKVLAKHALMLRPRIG